MHQTFCQMGFPTCLCRQAELLAGLSAQVLLDRAISQELSSGFRVEQGPKLPSAVGRARNLLPFLDRIGELTPNNFPGVLEDFLVGWGPELHSAVSRAMN